VRDALGGRPVGLRARACQLSGCLAHTEVWQLSRRWPGRDRVRAGDGAWHGHGTGRAAGSLARPTSQVSRRQIGRPALRAAGSSADGARPHPVTGRVGGSAGWNWAPPSGINPRPDRAPRWVRWWDATPHTRSNS